MALHGNWIKFKGIKKERGFNRHHITINHNGQIHINRAVHIDLGRPRAVTLYFEPTLNKIAIQPADPRDPGSVALIAKTFGAYYVPAKQIHPRIPHSHRRHRGLPQTRYQPQRHTLSRPKRDHQSRPRPQPGPRLESRPPRTSAGCGRKKAVPVANGDKY